jgi:hypothetical protein
MMMSAYQLDPTTNNMKIITRSYDLIDLVTVYRGVVLQLISTDGVPYTIPCVYITTRAVRRKRAHVASERMTWSVLNGTRVKSLLIRISRY